MKTLLISAGAGIALTVVFTLLAGMGGAACHCSSPSAVLFPYMTFTQDESFGGTLAVCQFLIYALAIGFANRLHRAGRPIVSVLLLVAHVTFAVLAIDELASRKGLRAVASAASLDAR